MWLRQKFVYCAQRRTGADFMVHRAPEIECLGVFPVFSILKKIATGINSIRIIWKCEWNQLPNPNITRFEKFSKLHIFSCPWVRPGTRSIFLPENLQKLSLAESESTYPTVGLDRRKSQTIDRLSSTEQKREKSEPKKVGPRFSPSGPAHHKLVLL